MPLLGCCATGENTTMLHHSSVMFYTGSQFPFESSSRSACWCTSRFIGQRLGICATIVRRRICPLRGYDFDRRLNVIFCKTNEDSAAGPRCWNKLPAALCAADSIDSFKTGLRPASSATHIPLLVDCKAPL